MTLTPEEQAFANTPEGRMALEIGRHHHDLGTRHLGARQPAFDERKQAQALRRAMRKVGQDG